MFADRLVNDEDRSWFSNLLVEKISKDFNETLENVVTSDPLLYADFMAMSRDQPPYVEITDHAKVLFLSNWSRIFYNCCLFTRTRGQRRFRHL